MPILILAIIAVVLLALAYRGNNAIQKTTYEVACPRLPSGFDGYRIALIADLHDHRFGPWQPRLLGYVRESRPDMIAIAGDLTEDGDYRRQAMREFARELVAIAPSYFVTGNHERHPAKLPPLLEDLQAAGVTVLQNTSLAITRGDEQIQLAGIDDPMLFLPGSRLRLVFQAWQAELVRLRESMPDDFTILLSHRPEFIRIYARLGFDVVLSGHAHGGQIRIPGIGPLYAPNQGKFPKYTEGVRTMEHTSEVISRGLGGSWVPVRVFNRPEVVIVTLRKAP